MLFVLLMMGMPSGCGHAVIGHDGLIERARKEISVSSAETIEMKIAGSVDIDNSSLVWFVTGNEYQAHAYFPMEFDVDKNKKDKFRFVRAYQAMDRGENIAVVEWKNGYSFLVNNDRCTSVTIGDRAGKKEEIKVDGVLPWLYFCETIPAEYVFLDADGNELN